MGGLLKRIAEAQQLIGDRPSPMHAPPPFAQSPVTRRVEDAQAARQSAGTVPFSSGSAYDLYDDEQPFDRDDPIVGLGIDMPDRP